MSCIGIQLPTRRISSWLVRNQHRQDKRNKTSCIIAMRQRHATRRRFQVTSIDRYVAREYRYSIISPRPMGNHIHLGFHLWPTQIYWRPLKVERILLFPISIDRCNFLRPIRWLNYPSYPADPLGDIYDIPNDPPPDSIDNLIAEITFREC